MPAQGEMKTVSSGKERFILGTSWWWFCADCFWKVPKYLDQLDHTITTKKPAHAK